jgi:hypothetical protein
MKTTKTPTVLIILTIVAILLAQSVSDASVLLTGRTIPSQAMVIKKPNGKYTPVTAFDPAFEAVDQGSADTLLAEFMSTRRGYSSNRMDCDKFARAFITFAQDAAMSMVNERPGLMTQRYAPAIGMAVVQWEDYDNLGNKVTKGHAIVIYKSEKGWFVMDPTAGSYSQPLNTYEHANDILTAYF